MSTGVAKVTLGDPIECFDNHIASSVALWFGSILILLVTVCTSIHANVYGFCVDCNLINVNKIVQVCYLFVDHLRLLATYLCMCVHCM